MKDLIVKIAGTAMVSMLLCMSFSSCNRNEENQGSSVQANLPKPVFYATLEGAGMDTKVYTDGAFHVLWNANDDVSMFVKNTLNEHYRFAGADGATGGYFNVVPGGIGTGNDLDYYFSVYPYYEDASYSFGADALDPSDDFILTKFPKAQSYLANSFGPNSNLMIAKSTTTNLSFKNVGGYLCLKLYGSGYTVRSIVLTGNNGETLSGPVKITLDGSDIPSMTFDTTDPSKLNKEIVLTAATPVALPASAGEAITFWIVVPPMIFTNGFTVRVIDINGGIHVKSTSKSIEISRSAQRLMAAFQITSSVEAPYTVDEMGAYEVPGTGGTDFVYNKDTDQVNLYEAENMVWARFLRIPTLTMLEIGPIPSDVTPSSYFTASVNTYVNGVLTESRENCKLTVQSITGGIINLVSNDGTRYAIRF